MRSIIISISWIGLVLTFHLVWCDDHASVTSGARDYTHVSTDSRVSDLVSFFESMRPDDDVNLYAQKKVKTTMISLAEAATKLHTLSDSFPLEVKCDKYVKLISKPNIRTFATVNELMKENKQFSETLQVDANLVSRLQDERTFDAMGRMQTILQSLESEKTLGVSDYEPIVQKDLLDCVNYYVYRHQRATFGVVSQVRDLMNKLPHSLAEYGGSEVLLRKFRQSLSKLKKLEMKEEEGNQLDHLSWLEELSKVQDLVIENNFEIPIFVQEFISNTTRLNRINLVHHALKRSEQLKQRLVELESDNQGNPTSNPEYLLGLEELYGIYASYRDILKKDIRQFFEEHGSRLDNIQNVSARSNGRGSNREINQEQPRHEHKTGSLIEMTRQNPHVKATEAAKQTQTDKRIVCNKLLDGFKPSLESFNPKSIDLDKANMFAQNINNFSTICNDNQPTNDNKDVPNSTNKWPMLSLATRLAIWAKSQLRENCSLTDKDRAEIIETTQILRKIVNHK